MSNNDISDLFPNEELEEITEAYVPQKQEKKAEKPQEDKELDKWKDDIAQKKQFAYKTIDETATNIFRKRTALIDYLTVQANFNRYTVRNALLVSAQDAGATKLKSYAEWNSEGYRLKKGCKPTIVLEPGGEYQKQDGSVGRYINVRTLYDVSKVQGLFPEKPSERSNRDKMSALIFGMSEIIKSVSDENVLNGRAAIYSNGIIYVNRTKGFDLLYQQIAIELAHARCAVKYKQNYSRQKFGAICEMSGYIVCTYSHVTTDDIPLRIPDEYKEFDSRTVCDILEIVRDTANDIIQNIFRGYKKSSTKAGG